MIDVAAGLEDELCEKIKTFADVDDAHIVAGDFDLIVELDCVDVHEVLATVTEDIRPLEGIGTTKTYICLD